MSKNACVRGLACQHPEWLEHKLLVVPTLVSAEVTSPTLERSPLLLTNLELFLVVNRIGVTIMADVFHVSSVLGLMVAGFRGREKLSMSCPSNASLSFDNLCAS